VLSEAPPSKVSRVFIFAVEPPPLILSLAEGLLVPIPTFCEVSIVTAVVPLLVANCNEPELSPLRQFQQY